MKNGSCKDCPDYERMQGSGTDKFQGIKCGPNDCNLRQILIKDTIEGGKCQDCNPYTRADYSFKVCQPDNCSDRHKLLEDGKCDLCPDWERSDGKLNRMCQPDMCKANYKLLISGKCEECPKGWVVTTAGLNARRDCEKIIDPCENNKLVLIDNDYYRQTYEI